MQHGKEIVTLPTQLAPWRWSSSRRDLSIFQERTEQASSTGLGLASYCHLICHFDSKYGLHFQDVSD